MFICLGILVAYLIGLPYISDKPQALHIGSHDIAWWRIMLAFGMLPAAAQVTSLHCTLCSFAPLAKITPIQNSPGLLCPESVDILQSDRMASIVMYASLSLVEQILQMVAMAALPESPVWLRWKGDSAAAGAAEKRLLGSSWEASAVSEAAQQPLMDAAAEEVHFCPASLVCVTRFKRGRHS